MRFKSLAALSLALTFATAITTIPAFAGTMRRANPSVAETDTWSFIATHISAGNNGQQFVNDIPMGPYATEAACVAVMQAYQPTPPPAGSDSDPWDGIFKTTCCVDNTTGAKDCGPN
jgi:hypothetical protein